MSTCNPSRFSTATLDIWAVFYWNMFVSVSSAWNTVNDPVLNHPIRCTHNSIFTTIVINYSFLLRPPGRVLFLQDSTPCKIARYMSKHQPMKTRPSKPDQHGGFHIKSRLGIVDGSSNRYMKYNIKPFGSQMPFVGQRLLLVKPPYYDSIWFTMFHPMLTPIFGALESKSQMNPVLWVTSFAISVCV